MDMNMSELEQKEMQYRKRALCLGLSYDVNAGDIKPGDKAA